jgi:type I restriction-modification system DNA methylase subunit
MDRKKEIVKAINDMSGSRSSYEVFYDWIALMALSIQNSCYQIHDRTWEKREEEYMRIITPYGGKGKRFAELSALLVETMDHSMSDVLGEIFMESGFGSKRAGQFFTPFNLSLLCARINVKAANERVTLNEPSCGSGGMVIATARAMLEKGIDYQKKLKVIAQDLDWKAVYMCYVQLSLYGIDAEVIQGNTLTDPYKTAYPCERVFKTPKKMGIL